MNNETKLVLAVTIAVGLTFAGGIVWGFKAEAQKEKKHKLAVEEYLEQSTAITKAAAFMHKRILDGYYNDVELTVELVREDVLEQIKFERIVLAYSK